MYTQSTFHLGYSPLFHNTTLSSPVKDGSMFFPSICLFGAKDRRVSFNFAARPGPIFKSLNQECTHVFQKEQPIELVNDDLEVEAHKVSTVDEVQKRIDYIKSFLGSMDGGRISTSAYDTAWVALIEDINESGTPQFPSCLQWIADNQLPDGSWGATYLFSAYDRLINTLACVIALKTWNIHPDKSEKGILFFKENFNKLEKENGEHMLIGFEIAFPSLIDLARTLDIELPDDNDPILKDIYAKRDLKLSKIPWDILHTEHTTLLFSLEGMKGLDWEKILKLQCPDGSILYSPASTASAVMQTKDENCLRYLSKLVEKFNGGVPYIYPVDMFARNWSVDRLQRLGISRYFQPEIKEMVNYVSGFWTERGLYSISNAPFYNIDDTAMGFRNLRLHGYDISPEAFWNFKHGDAFCCFPRQSSESVTAMYNTYRASQLSFPGEKVLEEAKNYTYKFLRERQAENQLVDKWVMPKDLPGEVGYSLEVPWYGSLPRVETRFYIEQYGGADDVWIGKSMYKMAEVNNNTYLELAKLDYNNCQAQHQIEWNTMLSWYIKSKLEDQFGVSERSVLFAYFLATASIFEPERSTARLAWAKSSILVEMVSSCFKKENTSHEQRRAFINEFRNSTILYQTGYKIGAGLHEIVVKTLAQISLDALEAHGRDISQELHQAWEMWLTTWQEEGATSYQSEAELLVRTINMCGDRPVSEEIQSHPQYKRLSELTDGVCHQLREYHAKKVSDKGKCNANTSNITTVEIESDMKKLVQLVLLNSADGIDSQIKQTFLTVAKSFYYTAYCTRVNVNIHMAKVLFQYVF